MNINNALQKFGYATRRLMAASMLVLLGAAALAVPVQAAETITYYHLDALGSPVAATDEQGNVKWREEYKPYGERIKQEAAAQANSRWYTGHPHDEATGLTYMGARYYDPVVGRFMAVDPVAFTEKNIHSFSRYGYANNNPYRYFDPDGMDSVLAQVGARWSGPSDLGHSVMRPYVIYTYDVHDLPGTGNASQAALLPPTGRVELTFEARQAGGRGSILGSEPKVGEMFSTDPRARHAIGISDVGATAADRFTTTDGVKFDNIRAHAGGPYASKGCATSPTYRVADRRIFERDFVESVGPIRRNQSLAASQDSVVMQRERTFIDIPAR